MADAKVGDQVLLSQGETEEGGGSDDPVMPHTKYRGVELDRLYPPVEVPEEEDCEDINADAHDQTLQKGLEAARDIQSKAEEFGRRRV